MLHFVTNINFLSNSQCISFQLGDLVFGDNAQKKTKECMTALEKFTGESGVYNYETGQLDMQKFQTMREKISGDLKGQDEQEGKEESAQHGGPSA